MAWYDSLLQMGAVPAGAKPKTIVEPEGEAGYYGMDPLSRAARGLDKMIKKRQAEEKRQAEIFEKKLDMYKTLRSSGYDAVRAQKAVEKMDFGDVTGIRTVEEEKGAEEIARIKAETAKIGAEQKKIETETEYIPEKNKPKLQAAILEKIANEEALTAGEQRVYDETIKHKGGDLESVLADKDKEKYVATKERILAKVAKGEKLLKGEQQIYDDIINKQSDSAASVDGGSGWEKSAIKMIKPDGKEVKVHPDDVQKAMQRGYKRK